MKAIKMLLWGIFLLFAVFCQAQEERYRIYGRVVDKQSLRDLKNIPIRVLPFDKELNTDKQGHFLFNMPRGEYRFEIDYYPYYRQDTSIVLISDTVLTFYMEAPKWSYLIEEVEVEPLAEIASERISVQHLEKIRMKSLPDMLGEKDPLKVLSLGAGVNTGSEGSVDLQVRGGSGGQNLYLMDGIPLYSSSHLLGMVSAYNPVAVDNAALYKAAFPARFGGRIASVLDVETCSPDLEKTHADLEIGLLSSKVLLQTPVVKGKLAWYAAGRYSNYSLLNLLTRSSDTHYQLYFADLNTALLWKISEKDSLKWTGFWNGDKLNARQQQGQSSLYGWMENSQYNTALQWNRRFSEQARNEMQVYADAYDFRYGNATESPLSGYSSQGTLSSVNSFAWKDRFDYRFDSVFSLSAGASLVHYFFSPAEKTYTDTLVSVSRSDDVIPFSEASVYAEGRCVVSGHDMSFGMRLNDVWGNRRHYLSLEPRLSYRYSYNRNVLSASVAKTTQAIHRLSNSGLGFPFEFFLPSGELSPEESWIFTLGVGRSFSWKEGGLNLHSEWWYKKMSHLLEWKDGYDVQSLLLSQENLSDLTDYVCQGEGYAFGWDVSLAAAWKKWHLSADYTLMRVRHRFDELNDGNYFDAMTDIRNSLSLTLSWQCAKSVLLSASWQYQSGRPLTVPTAYFAVSDKAPYSYQRAFVPVYTERNNFRTKDFHKLDVSMSHRFLLANRFPSTLSVGVYNVYNRSNAFMYYFSEEETESGHKQPVLKMMSIFPILPSVSWSVSF